MTLSEMLLMNAVLLLAGISIGAAWAHVVCTKRLRYLEEVSTELAALVRDHAITAQPITTAAVASARQSLYPTVREPKAGETLAIPALWTDRAR